MRDTALRETEEEIGLKRDAVEVIGELPKYETRTGFSVKPIVGLIKPPFELNVDRKKWLMSLRSQSLLFSIVKTMKT